MTMEMEIQAKAERLHKIATKDRWLDSSGTEHYAVKLTGGDIEQAIVEICEAVEAAKTVTAPPVMVLLKSYILEQLKFQHYYVKKRFGKFLPELTLKEKNGIIRDMVLAAIGELIEFLEKGTNWKGHRPEHEINRAEALEEYVDAMKYLLNIFIYMDIREDEFSEAFRLKSKAVFNRFFAEFPAEAAVDTQAGGG